MSPILSERTINVLRASLPAVEAHRSLILEGMTASLRAADRVRDERRAARVAAALVDMLIEQGRHFAAGDGPRDIHEIRLDHSRNGIGAFHYTCFGDAITAVMVDAAGNALRKPVGGAWSDAFWAVIRRVKGPDISRPDTERERTGAASPDEGQPLKILA